MVRNALWLAAAVWLAAGSLLDQVSAGSLAVSPVRVELPADGKSRTVRVQNQTSHGTLVQVEAVAWEGNVDTARRVKEILAVPPVFQLPGDGQQILRLAVRQPLREPKERAFRLLITEVPQETGPPGGLMFSLRLNLPLFVKPEGAEAKPAWQLREIGRAGELVLRNDGNAHVRIQELTLVGTNEAFAWETADITYALAGESVSWPLGKSLAELPATMEVRAETNRGPITATVTRPGG
jgi:fimbrial chaperone protein